jgi:SNF2 family DNA or RNA helicase
MEKYLEIDSWIEIDEEVYLKYKDTATVWEYHKRYFTAYYYLPNIAPIQEYTKEFFLKCHIRRNKRLSPPEVPIPKVFDGIEFTHQKEACGFIRECKGTLLADPVGSGKTIEAILAVADIFENGGSVCVICEASKKFDWAKEFRERLLIGDEDIVVISRRLFNSQKARRIVYFTHPKLLIFNYEYLYRDASEIKSCFKNYNAIIIDEAHRIKSYNSQTARSLRHVSPRNIRRIALTATPYEIDLGELYSILSWCAPYHVPKYSAFLKRYTIDSSFGVYYKRKNEFASIASEHILKRSHSDIGMKLPDIEVKVIYHDLNSDQKKIYTKVKNRIENVFGDKRLGLYRTLLQICLCPLNLKTRNFYNTSEKISICDKLLHEEEKEKFLIFSQSKRFVNILANHFSELNPAIISGDVDDYNREVEVEKFNTETRVLIATSAAERGLNLQSASRIILVDPLSNPARVRQRIGRILRIGQEASNIRIFALIARGTIEERMAQLAMQRAKFFDKYVGKDQLSYILQHIKPHEI